MEAWVEDLTDGELEELQQRARDTAGAGRDSLSAELAAPRLGQPANR
ncbi:hypothetical protein OG478_52615 [Streptomyces phaeochromogenes]|nr:hypothetical protein OG478_00125 [Streptomyces phaeochromogenes]WSS99678.1 hypothetical protein OG478_52615 [Streptomyces phaeochromogenes]